MSAIRDLTLRRWLPVICPEATRAPSGRVARVMAYYLANGRGKANARHWLDYLSEMEPEQLDRLRIGLALTRSGREREFSGREMVALRRRVRAALATARRRWNLPLCNAGDERFYVALPEDEALADGEASAAVYHSRNEDVRRRWGGSAIILTPGGRTTP